MVVGHPGSSVCLPEVRVGVVAVAGALPRIARHVGIKRAAEMALVAEPIPANKAYEWGLINQVVDKPEDVLPAALTYARKIVKGSPEGIYVSLRGILRGAEDTNLSSFDATVVGASLEYPQQIKGDNLVEGKTEDF